MEYEELEKKLIFQIINNDSNCMNTIENNKNVIQNYFSNEKLGYIKRFISKLNNIILNEIDDYSLVEKILYHKLFTTVFEYFKQSTVLIDAIRKENKKAIEWLLKMKINKYIQDEKGMTSLMHAAQHSLFDVVKTLLENNNDLLNIRDNEGNTVLFYSLNTVFFYLCQNVSDLDFNQKNYLDEDMLIYSCKFNNFVFFEKILAKTKDFMHESKEGKTAATYLVEQGQYTELKLLLIKIKETNQYNDYLKKYNNQLIIILINQLKRIYSGYIRENLNIEIKKYFKILITLEEMHFDFNIIIDEEGNTPIMFFLMSRDYYSAIELLEKYEDLNLSIKNKNGISFSYLSLLVDKENSSIMTYLLFHKNFDYYYTDPLQNNILMLFVYHGFTKYILKIITRNRNLLTTVNNKLENIVIMSTKLGELKSMYITPENINQQDIFGNTALYYALNLRNKEEINLLAYNKADQNLKNSNGISPLDFAEQMNDKEILKILRKPIDPIKMSKKVKKENKKLNMDIKNISYEKEYQYLNDQLHSLTYKPIKFEPMYSIIRGFYSYHNLCRYLTYVPTPT